jgi:hypothetical protein
MIRLILAVPAGVIMFCVVWISLEYLNAHLFPIAANPESTYEDVQQFINRLPLHKQMMIASNFIIGSLLAGFASSSITKIRHLRASIAVGILIVTMAAMLFITIPQPVWMAIISFLAPIPFAVLGSKIAQRP